MLSFHDHHVRQFLVDAGARRVRLVTAFPTPAGPEFAEALFEDVAAYVIKGDALGTIIFDIEEVDPAVLYDRFSNGMQASARETGGHAAWAESRELAKRFFAESGARGFEVSSSIGFYGAIWAQSLTARALENLSNLWNLVFYPTFQPSVRRLFINWTDRSMRSVG